MTTWVDFYFKDISHFLSLKENIFVFGSLIYYISIQLITLSHNVVNTQKIRSQRTYYGQYDTFHCKNLVCHYDFNTTLLYYTGNSIYCYKEAMAMNRRGQDYRCKCLFF